jgi:ABC-2 type transport system permease protein
MADLPAPPSVARTAPTPTGAPPAAPGAVYAALRVFDLSLGHMLWSRRTVFMGLVVGVPVVLSVALRALVALGAPVLHIGGGRAGGAIVFGLMMWGFFIRFAVPVLAVFYGTALIADEVDDKTITYLFTRPVPRGAILVGKYLAYLACTAGVALPSVMAVWLLAGSIGGELASSFVSMVKDLGIVLAGFAAYGAVFALAGARLRRPLIFGLVFVFGWESLALALPGSFKNLTVAYYLQSLVPHAMPADSALGLMQAMFREPMTLGHALIGLAAIVAVSLWLAARTVARREYVLEQ